MRRASGGIARELRPPSAEAALSIRACAGSWWRPLAAALVAAIVGGCGPIATPAPVGPEAGAWRYDFQVDEGLTRLEATVCFEGRVPEELVPIDASGRRYLRSADALVGPTSLPLTRTRTSVRLDGLPDDACIRYVVDLDAAARQRGGIHGAYRINGDLVASTAVWLWAPRARAEDARVTARFELPEGIGVSPLWVRTGDGRRRLDERAFRFTAYAAFGRFPVRHLGVPGSCIHVSVLGGGVEMGPDALVDSLGESATAASMMFGRFPVSEVGLLAVPTPFSSTSPFGVVGRGTMPTVAIMVGERAEPDRLARAWVPVHEFSHLATPFIAREDAWLSEGIATYYQEVLRARAGLITPEDAWRNLDDGFARGARDGTGRTIADESRHMMETAAFRRVYWAGAAIALMADVELRQRTAGRRSLDDALESLSECCAGGSRPLSGEEVMRRLDADEPRVFVRVARAHLGSSAFPDLGPTYEALGLRRTDAGLEAIEAPGASALRDAIMAPRTDLDPVPPCPP